MKNLYLYSQKGEATETNNKKNRCGESGENPQRNIDGFRYS